MRLLLDEMYARHLAEALRERGHDVVSAAERDDLRAVADAAVFEVAQAERRVIVTNNVRDFMPLAEDALRTAATFYGICFTSDRSLPRNKASIGKYVKLLDALLARHGGEEMLPGTVEWLSP